VQQRAGPARPGARGRLRTLPDHLASVRGRQGGMRRMRWAEGLPPVSALYRERLLPLWGRAGVPRAPANPEGTLAKTAAELRPDLWPVGAFPPGCTLPARRGGHVAAVPVASVTRWPRGPVSQTYPRCAQDVVWLTGPAPGAAACPKPALPGRPGSLTGWRGRGEDGYEPPRHRSPRLAGGRAAQAALPRHVAGVTCQAGSPGWRPVADLRKFLS
jgi:hypothetical protein